MKFERRGDITPEEQQQMEKLEQEEQQQEQEKPEKVMKKRQKSVLMYMSLLFIVALGLVVLSYFVQQRRADSQISDLNQQHSEFSIQALENIEEMQNNNLALQQELDELEDRLTDMQAQQEAENQTHSQELADLEEAYTELSNKYRALEALYNMRAAIEAGDAQEAAAQGEILRPLKESLEEEQLQDYLAMMDEMGLEG